MVNVYSPFSLNEALRLKQSKQVIPFAGGTDLMVKRKNWAGVSPKFEKDVLFIGHIKELKNIKFEKNKLVIGANCTLTEIIENELVPKYIKNVLFKMASPAIRNIATIGGNICNSSPAGDILPVLYALNANLLLKNMDDERRINIEDFIYAPGKNILREDELLTEIIIPRENFNIMFYKKIGTRKANALSKVSFFALAKIYNKKIIDVRIALGAVSPTIIREEKIEEKIKNLDKKEIIKNIQKIKEMYFNLIHPIDDQRSRKEYRKKVISNLLEYFLLKELNL